MDSSTVSQQQVQNLGLYAVDCRFWLEWFYEHKVHGNLRVSCN